MRQLSKVDKTSKSPSRSNAPQSICSEKISEIAKLKFQTDTYKEIVEQEKNESDRASV